ncbi:MAG: oxidoreductase [Bacillota bacterium]|nr:oxidoreductase [Bacillota bacterium]MDW7678696.1 oxidoreductase [Bacillota bacterium]
MIQTAIIGYGLSGQVFHGALLETLDDFNVHTVVTTDPEKKMHAMQQHPSAHVVDDPDAMFADDQIDLVVISTPNTYHHPLAKKALRAGKHVIVEKPFTVNSEEAEDLIKTSAQANRMLTVYQNRRYDSDFMTLQQVIASRELGEIRLFESAFDRFRPEVNLSAWREKQLPGSGILYDLGAHLIDQTVALFGLPVSLYADVQSLRGGSVDDHFEIVLDYPDMKATLTSRPLIKEPLPRFAIHGLKGSFVKYGLDVQEDDLKAGKRRTDNTWGEEPESQWGILNTTSRRVTIPSLPGNYYAFYEAVHAHLTGGSPMPITAQDGKNVIRMIELAIESSQTGCKVRFNG